MNRIPRRYPASAWWIGILLLVGIGVAVWYALDDGRRLASGDGGAAVSTSSGGSSNANSRAPGSALPELMKVVEPEAVGEQVVVRGVVVDGAGRPIEGATATLYEKLTAWPEWRRVRIEDAITSDDGSFQFRCRGFFGHLVGVQSRRFGSALHDVPMHGGVMRMELQSGYDLHGYVLNDVGAPVSNARVTVESVPREERRVLSVRTAADGSYLFENVSPGPARLVARHESWQPAEAPALVIGDRRRCDFRFERPSMAPMQGVVLDGQTQQPVEGAEVALLPINQAAGLVGEIATKSAADGSFLLAGLPRGSMRLFVRHPEHGSVLRSQTIGAAARDLVVDMPARSRFGGQMVTFRYSVAFTGDEVLELKDAFGELYYAELDGEGRFQFAREISPGIAELRVLGALFSFRRSNGSSTSLLIAEEAELDREISVVPAASVRGRCVDEAGDPIVGALIQRTRLLSESFRYISTAAWGGNLRGAGGGLLRLLDVDVDEQLVVTDQDGYFEITGFPPGPLLARASAEGRGSRWLQLFVPPIGQAKDVGNIVLPPGQRLQGRVLRGREPFAGATVTVVGEDGQSLATTNAEGIYVVDDLVPGRYSVRAKVTGRATGATQQNVTIGADPEADVVDLRLSLGRIVRGRVVNKQRDPLPDVIVSVRGRFTVVSATDRSGEFELELPRRASELMVSTGDRSRQKVVPLQGLGDQVEIVLDAPPTCTLQARVFGLPARRRLSGALLRMTPIGLGVTPRAVTRWVEMSAGELRRSHVPAGLVRIELWCEGYAPFSVERVLRANETHALGDLLLEPGSRLRGVVRGPDGEALAGAYVWLGEQTDADLFTPRVQTDSEGNFVISGVTGKSSQLVVRHPAFAAREIGLQLPQDVLSIDPLEVVLERGTTIAVSVAARDVSELAVVYLRRGGRLLASASLDEKGRAWFANRSAGNYVVSLFGDELPDKPVRVRPGVKVVGVRLER